MAIAFDDAVVHDSGAGADSDSFSKTCTGSDLTLIVAVCTCELHTSPTPATVSGITYNGVSLSHIHTVTWTDVDSHLRIEFWALDDPDTGSNTVAVTLDRAVNSFQTIAVSYTGSQGFSANTGSTTGYDADLTFSISTTDTTSLVLAAGDIRSPGTYFTPAANNTERIDNNGTDTTVFWCDTPGTGGSVTAGETAAGIQRFAAGGVELLEATAGAERAPKMLKPHRSIQIPIHQLRI